MLLALYASLSDFQHLKSFCFMAISSPLTHAVLLVAVKRGMSGGGGMVAGRNVG